VVLEEADDGLSAVECFKRALALPIDHHKGQIDIHDIEEKSNRSFDLVVLDYIMKTLHGPDTAAAIRSLGFTGKIIGVTGNALPDDIEEFKQKGADHVLIKPLRADELAKVL
jgi:CheY-like chemotaxis protein